MLRRVGQPRACLLANSWYADRGFCVRTGSPGHGLFCNVSQQIHDMALSTAPRTGLSSSVQLALGHLRGLQLSEPAFRDHL